MKYFDSIASVRKSGLPVDPIFEDEINYYLRKGEKLAIKDGWLAIVDLNGVLIKNFQTYGNIVIDD
ncbi:hypothetical protein [Carnobacterium divergens]|uniref:hypothetical protein n=1 Tax=Carnobacterium divergens TaxID=2748 RepID=UPI0039B0AE41